MSTANVKIPYSFLQFQSPEGYTSCAEPLVNLPMVVPRDLSFQLMLNAPAPGNYPFAMQNIQLFSGGGSISGTTLTITEVFLGSLYNDMPLYYPSGSPQTLIPPQIFIVSQLTGTPGGVGTYQLNQNLGTVSSRGMVNIAFNLAGAETNQKMLGTLGARICLADECGGESAVTPTNDFQWICTGCAFILSQSSYIFYFQPTGMYTEFEALPVGTCFNICIYELGLAQTTASVPQPFENIGGISPYGCVGSVSEMRYCSSTVFYKAGDECESYPTSLLQYVNVSDAFGFFYDSLGQFPNNINFLNSIRLPLYLHSPEEAEDQMSYQLSDGSTLKLTHRIWTDYKFKTDYLDKFLHKCLAVATAHDYVFIVCPYEGLDPWAGGPYFVGNNPTTQFVRTEKITVDWKQADIPRFKLGQGEGVLRLALPASNVNSNCD